MPTSRKRSLKVRERVSGEHGFYRIVAGRLEGTCRAVAYLGNRKIEERDGDTVEAAIAALKRVLEERMADLRRTRRGDGPGDSEFLEALMALRGPRVEPAITVLVGHARRSGACATPSELARANDTDEGAILSAHARLGRKLGSLLGFAPEAEGIDPTLAPILTFAVLERRGTEEVTLRLRPEVLAAFDGLRREAAPLPAASANRRASG